jgi:protease IV
LLQVYLQPSGQLFFAGLATATPFVRGFLDKWKVDPLFFTRCEYKNAANVFTQSGFTDAHREASQSLLASMSSQITQARATILTDRHAQHVRGMGANGLQA